MKTTDSDKVDKLLLHLAELVFEKHNRESSIPHESSGYNLSREQIEARENFLIRRIAELMGITNNIDPAPLTDAPPGSSSLKEIFLVRASKETVHSINRLLGSTSFGIELAMESYLFYKEMCSWESRGIFTKNELELFWEYYSTEARNIGVEHFSFTGSRQGLVNVINFLAMKRPLLFLLHNVTKEKLRNKVLKVSNAHLHMIIEEMILSIQGINNRNKEKFLQIYAGTK